MTALRALDGEPEEPSVWSLDEMAERLGLTGEATISVERAGKVLGIGRGLAYDAVRTGDLPSVRVGRRVLVPVPQLLQLLRGS